MILAAGLLVLLGLGLFVGGFLTGVTAFYWGCVVVCVVAAVLLYLARRAIARAENAAAPPAAPVSAPVSAPPAATTGERATVRTATAVAPAVGATATGATASGATATGATASGAPAAGGTAPATASPAAQADEEPAPREGAHVARTSSGSAPGSVSTDEFGDPPIEDVEVTDLLLVVDLKDEVFVVDEHPRYHLAECRYLAGRTTFPLPLDEARTDGFTPCALCAPDRNLAERERAWKRGAGS